jgi:AcrR family transcriptional regulator
VTERALRADARRNRARVLDAADAAFAVDGVAAPMDEIARRAGVGVGTLYRHFPTKEALVEAIVARRVEGLVGDAGELLAGDDPGAAFFEFVGRVVEMGAAKRDLAEALDVAPAVSDQVKLGLRCALGELLARAQSAGAVRPDVEAGDVMALLAAAFAAPDRLLAVVRDGLRAPGQRPTA